METSGDEPNVTTTYEEFPDVGITIKTVVQKTGGRTVTDRDIDIDIDIDCDDFGDDIVDNFDYVAASKAITDHPACKKLAEVIPDPTLHRDISAGLDTMWKIIRERAIVARKEADEAELDAAMAKQEARMMELCPDGDYRGYSAFLEQNDMTYVFIEPGFYVSMRTPPS